MGRQGRRLSVCGDRLNDWDVRASRAELNCAWHPCCTFCRAVCIQQREEEVQAAKAQLQAADASVTELRGQLAALNSDFKGQLAAKDVQMAEMQASAAKLTEQLADADASKRQAEEHAGVKAGVSREGAEAAGIAHRDGADALPTP